MVAAFGSYRFNLKTLELRKFGVRLPLEEKPARLLACLIERRGTVVSREELRNYLWDETVNLDFDHGLNKAVNKLRALLGDDASEPRYLETLSRRGYRFIGDVDITLEPQPAAAVMADRVIAAPAKLEVRASGDVDPASTALLEPVGANDGDTESSEPLFLFSKRRRSFTTETQRAASRRRSPQLALLATAGILLTVVAAVLLMQMRNRKPPSLALRAVITLPADLQLITKGEAGIAISPDGTQVVFDAVGSDGRARLWLRRFDSLTPEPIPGTEGGTFPFWSPDGHDLGFFTNVELKRINLADKTVVTLCGSDSGRGGTWSRDGTILFARETQSPIFRIGASGGEPTPVTHLDLAHYTTHRWPAFLADQKHYVFLAANHNDSATPGALYMASLDGGDPILLGEADSNAIPLDGSLLFLSHGKLIEQKLDQARATLEPHAEIVGEGVDYDPGSWYGTFAATTSALIYRSRPEHREQHVIAWFDAKGNRIGAVGQPGIFAGLSLSPDGKTIAALCGDPEFNVCLIHADGTTTQITQHGIAGGLAWLPDSSGISYGIHEGHTFSTFIKPVNDSIREKLLMKSAEIEGILSWHTDKRHALLLRATGNANYELMIFDQATGMMAPYLPPQRGLLDARFSPDGAWVAYQKAMGATNRIFVAKYPHPTKEYLVATIRGVGPKWRGDGRELYFLGPDEVVCAVSINPAGENPVMGTPRRLFHAPVHPVASDFISYDVAHEGTRFLVDTMGAGDRSELALATNWRHF